MNSLIKASSLFKRYNQKLAPVEVLRGINLEVKKTELLCIQGPSGAGKSTLLHILGGLDHPTSGEVLWVEKNIYKFNENELANFRNKKVGFVFQFYHLLQEFCALENVLLPSLFLSWWERKKALKHAEGLLKRLGLGHRLSHRPNQLSGGEQQRVAIARALINRPQLLLCDEPTGNLDSESGKNILSLLKELNQQEEMAIVLVTHDKDIAEVADRTVHLKDGVVI